MRSGKKKEKKRYGLTALLLCALLGLSAFCPISVSAEERAVTVRVGYYQSRNFQDGASEGEGKSGYGYEYLQKISYYSGWKYEYVYGDRASLYGKLTRGEIDVMAGLFRSELRDDRILLPEYEMGSESYYIYKHVDDPTISSTDLSTLESKKIGVVRNAPMADFLNQWTVDNLIGIEIIGFDDLAQCEQAVYQGKIDGFAATGTGISADSLMTPVVRIGEDPMYLAVTGSRKALLEELNEAMSMMSEVEPYVTETLRYKYFGDTAISRHLSEKEKAWLEMHPVLKIGYFDDYMPYCGTGEDGKPTGIMTDVLDALLKEVSADEDLTVEYRAFRTDAEMIASLTSGELDMVFPVASSLTEAENDGYVVSAPVASAGMYLVYSGIYGQNTTEKIAVNSANFRQYRYTQAVFPDSEIVWRDSVEDCLTAILDGKANSTVINGARLSLILGQSDYESMAYILLSRSDDRCFAVKAGNDGLLILLNRGLKLIGSDYGVNAINRYVSADQPYSFKRFIKENAVLIIAVVLAVAFLVVFFFARDTQRMRQQEKERAEYQKVLEENQKRLEEKNLEQEKTNAMLDEAWKQAESANEAKTAFLFNMSHDIRTPMNAIIGFTSLLEMYQENPERRSDYLKKIRDSSSMLLSIINNVLEMARIEKGTLAREEIVWSAEQFNDTLCSVFQEMMEHKGIVFTRKIDVSHPYVFCDPIKLREIFINILSNACKYTPSGGKVEMILEEVPSDREGYVLYRTTISDTGIGMSEDFLPHIFEEFTRENTTTDNKIEGTGLGMSIVKRLVDFLDGTIEVTSKKGVGSSFVVTLPHRIADKSDLVDHSGAEFDPKLFQGKRILLAEDNDLNAEIAIEILRESGFEVERAEDGRIAVEMLETSEEGYYDLVLMDIQMPNMNGYEAAGAIRALKGEKAIIPIVAMTANAFEEDKKTALRAGMNAHLAKPVDVKELLKTIAGMVH